MQKGSYRLLNSGSTQLKYLHDHLSAFSKHGTTFSTTYHTERHPLANSQVQSKNPRLFGQFYRVLQDCILSGDLRAAKSVHNLLIKFNFIGFMPIWNKVLTLYCRHGNSDAACYLFDNMSQRDVVSYNAIISADTRDGNVRKAVYLYSVMREEDIYPNHITLATLIRALPSGDVVHAQVVRYGLSCNEFVGSSLVDGYAKKGRLDDAIRAFGEIAALDLVSWNIMINGCAINNSKDDALRMFSWMLVEIMVLDGFTLTSVIKTCSEPKDLYCGMLLHGIAVKTGLAIETPLCNSLITMYSKCEEVMTSAEKIFAGIDLPNIISWTAMVAGCMQNEQNEEAIGIYRKMLESDVEENHFSFASILPAYGNLANLDQGRQIHARIVKSWFGRDISVNNALIDMYSKCGSFADANLLFLTMESHDIVSYTAMITCFGQHGKGREAIDILQNMIGEGLVPDNVTFLGCLAACSHSGLLDEGIQVFRMMVDVYHQRPAREHFSCLIDILGRAGRLKEAERFIYCMGIESDVVVWETLLGACSVHRERDLAEQSAERIKELQPERHGPCVLLANIYADRELWEDKGAVRERLGAGGLRKEAGHSMIAQ
ncbi:hypothetical protein Ancab_006430 [Ancistrocladus abbreviatus]